MSPINSITLKSFEAYRNQRNPKLSFVLSYFAKSKNNLVCLATDGQDDNGIAT